MLTAVGYVRVSTADQAATGESLELQKRKVRAAAELGDYELVDLIVDAGASAKNLRREGADRLLELVKARKVDAVIVHKLDRLTRSVRDLGDLLELFDRHSVALVSVTESLDTGTAAGRMVLNIMGSVAQWEREVIAERTRDALQAKKARGERVGQVPFGFALAPDGVALVEDAREQKVLHTLRELREHGSTLRGVAVELNAQGFTTRSGSPWRFEYVRSVLKTAA